jgi:hypothetical protein
LNFMVVPKADRGLHGTHGHRRNLSVPPIRLNFDGLGRNRHHLGIRYRRFGDISVGARPKIGCARSKTCSVGTGRFPSLVAGFENSSGRVLIFRR